MVVATLATFVRLVVADPGVVLDDADDAEQGSLCADCGIRPPRNALHCDTCGVCIMDMDHVGLRRIIDTALRLDRKVRRRQQLEAFRSVGGPRFLVSHLHWVRCRLLRVAILQLHSFGR